MTLEKIYFKTKGTNYGKELVSLRSVGDSIAIEL